MVRAKKPYCLGTMVKNIFYFFFFGGGGGYHAYLGQIRLSGTITWQNLIGLL